MTITKGLALLSFGVFNYQIIIRHYIFLLLYWFQFTELKNPNEVRTQTVLTCKHANEPDWRQPSGQGQLGEGIGQQLWSKAFDSPRFLLFFLPQLPCDRGHENRPSYLRSWRLVLRRNGYQSGQPFLSALQNCLGGTMAILQVNVFRIPSQTIVFSSIIIPVFIYVFLLPLKIPK